MDEWRFTPVRIAIFEGLLVIFGLIGGFTPPEGGTRAMKLWLLLIVLFVGGSASATMGDQTYGNIDRSSLRFFYLAGGVLAILVASYLTLLW